MRNLICDVITCCARTLRRGETIVDLKKLTLLENGALFKLVHRPEC